MLTHLHQLAGQALRAAAAGLLVVTLVFVTLAGASTQALASPKGTLSETMDLKLTEAAQEFLETILDDYADALEGSFGEALKPLKSVTKDLTKQLSKAAAAPDSASATTLAPQVDTAKTALDTAATTFDSLVADTAKFKSSLGSTSDQLKAALETQIGPKFDELQTALKDVSDAIALLSEDTAGLAAADPAEAVTTYTEHSTLLTEAIESAKTVISALGD